MRENARLPTPSALVIATVFVFHDGTAAQGASLQAAKAQIAPDGLEVKVTDVVVGADDYVMRNRVIGRAKGSYIAVVDAGSVPDPDWLASSIAVLRNDPTLGVVGAGAPAGLRIDPASELFVARRSMWEATRGFDESVGAGVQGLSLGWRCWLLGWRAAAVDVAGAAAVAPAERRQLETLATAVLRDVDAGPGRRRLSLRAGNRARLQAARRRGDAEIGALLLEASQRGGAAAEMVSVVESTGSGRILGGRRRIVVATADTLAPTMAGPGIRALKIASTLALDHDVHLVTTGNCELDGTDFPIGRVDDEALAELVEWADLVVFQGWVMADRPWMVDSDAVIVADIYDPMHLEQLEHGRDAPAEGGRADAIAGATETLNDQLRRGDYFLCASAKQRDLWLGQLAGLGRINQVTYDEDNAYRDRMRIVPFGIEDVEPVANRSGIRDAHPGIGPDDEVIVWGGGIYNWFDPLTLIRAVDALRRRRPSVRLYFLGTRHPNPEIPEMQMAVAARTLSEELDLTDSHVFFNDGWVPYGERADYLLDADVAVSIHRAHIETEFSFRTRLLDYLWCALPIVATEGDSFESVIEENDLGVTVAPGDVAALEAALETLLADPDRRHRIADDARRVVADFRWPSVLEPVRDLCRTPTRAPDMACPDTAVGIEVGGRPAAWRQDMALARQYVSEGGVRLLVNRVRSRVDRRRAEAD